MEGGARDTARGEASTSLTRVIEWLIHRGHTHALDYGYSWFKKVFKIACEQYLQDQEEFYMLLINSVNASLGDKKALDNLKKYLGVKEG